MVTEKNFIVHEPKDGQIEGNKAKGILSYTDGSLLNQKTGCGVHTVKYRSEGEAVIYNGNFYLGDTSTVFQAEVTAIKKSAEMLLNAGYENQSITFYSDSQASLAALKKITINSDTVAKCITALNRLGKNNYVHLKWVKAHVGIAGNKRADFLAKRGSTLGVGSTNEIRTPKTEQKKEIERYFLTKWWV